MKALLDENLSRRLIESIHDLFPGSIHVTQAGLSSGTADRKVWDYALQNGFIILTADTDFISLANALGPTPKVILLENCDYPTSDAAKVIRTNAAQIAELERIKHRSSFFENHEGGSQTCYLRLAWKTPLGWLKTASVTLPDASI